MKFGALARVASIGSVVGICSLIACNAIIGVTDVTFKRPDAGDSKGDDDDIDPGEPIDSAVTQRPNVLNVVLGELHACARRPAGTVQCWGDDTQGQTGSGGTAADAGIVASPVDATGITDAVDIAAGRSHTCVARKSGKVSCWGYNLDGQLGNGETGQSPAPVDVVGINNAFLVAAGGNFSCAVRGTGTVACWGGNAHGQLGNGNQDGKLTPDVASSDLKDVISISAGQSHACAVKVDGTVLCWGEGENGQLGTGSTDPNPTPTAVSSLPKSVAVAAGERSTCALTTTDRVFCWGANEVGQLGSGAANANPNPAPIAVAGLTDAVAIATGRNHACAVRKNGQVVCWGDGSFGQLGDGVEHDAGAANLVTVAAITAGFKVGAGSETSCATTQANEVLCWGNGDRGQLGAGEIGTTLAPTGVVGYPQ